MVKFHIYNLARFQVRALSALKPGDVYFNTVQIAIFAHNQRNDSVVHVPIAGQSAGTVNRAMQHVQLVAVLDSGLRLRVENLGIEAHSPKSFQGESHATLIMSEAGFGLACSHGGQEKGPHGGDQILGLNDGKLIANQFDAALQLTAWCVTWVDELGDPVLSITREVENAAG